MVIAGAGVAGLEAAFALRELAHDRVAITLLDPRAEFVYRPMTVLEPFGYSAAKRYPLDEIAAHIGAELVHDGFRWVEPDSREAHAEGGLTLPYDALVLAMGARPHARFKHALTIDDRVLDQQLEGVIRDVEGGYARRLAFLIPVPMAWPMPIYELALMTAQRAFEMNVDTSITIVTPEDAPLALFGTTVSEAIASLLSKRGIETVTSAHPEVLEAGRVLIRPGERSLEVDRIIALPQLFGPPAAGVGQRARDGFLAIDEHCRVRGLEWVYAAGDATNFSVKLGGVAAQQADTAATSIAALAGVPVESTTFHPRVRAVLLGGDRPLYLSAYVTGGHGSSSEISETPSWSPATKIDARYLAPYLDARDRVAGGVES